ncbi:MAG: RNA polymerase sigma factor, partial [Thermoanaerobaculia bacterium]
EAPGANPDQEADLESMEQVRRGEAAGAARLFQRYAAPLLRFTGRILGDPAEAEEITQDVFLKLMMRADQYDGRAPVASWLFAIATNACRDRLRRSVRRPSVALEAVTEVREPGIPADERLAQRQRREAVRRALSELSLEQREALVLARYHGMPYAEIARALDISEGAVKTRIFRAMETLKAHFSEGDSSWNAARL